MSEEFMFSFLYEFFRISDVNNEAKKFILRLVLVHYLFVFFISFANMFILLEALTYLNLSQVAILLGIFLLTESIVAFPAGTLGDSKSFRIILSLSVLFYFITYRLVVVANTFNEFVLVYIFLGISSALLLDNFFSFFDNNYDYYVYEDTTRNIYSSFIGVFVAVKSLILALGLLMGAYVAHLYSKVDLFSYSSFFLIIAFLLTLLFFKDHQSFKLEKKNRSHGFLTTFKETLKYSWKKRSFRFFIIGVVIINLTSVLWIQLYSVLLYSKIGHTDQFIGFLFSSEVIITAILIGSLGILVGRVTKTKFWFLASLLISYPILYFGLSWFITSNPIPTSFNLNYTLVFLLAFFVFLIPYNFNDILYYRVILDLVPENYRGSIYSLIDSLTSILGAAILFIGSNYLANYSLSQSFTYLGLIGLVGSIIIALSLIKTNLKTTIKRPIGFFTAFLGKTRSGFSNFFLLNNDLNLGSYQATLNTILGQLTSIAMADYQITSEEKEMIDIIVTDVQAYFTMLNDFDNDRSTKKKEKKELLKKQKENILQHAYTNASNYQMNEDITQLLTKLQEIIKTL